jgi:MinD superfamily P-loop ATPase
VANLSRRAFLTGLAPTAGHGPELDVVAEINQGKCIAWNQNICYTCKDRCPADAIKSLSGCDPVIEIDRCTGCGECVAACFVRAISMNETLNQTLNQKETEKEGFDT